MRAFADKLGRLAIEEDLGKVAPASRMKFRAWDDLVVQEDSPSYEAPEGLVSVLLRVVARVCINWDVLSLTPL
jgi:hypothetical protein